MSQPSDTPETRKLCRYCGHPEANAKDWADIEPGKGEEFGLCWDGEVCRHDAESAIDRLIKERDAAREDARRLTDALYGAALDDRPTFTKAREEALAAHEALTAKDQPATLQA